MPQYDQANTRVLNQVQTACLFLLAAVAVGFAASALQTVLLPFVLALFFSFCLAPLTELLRKRLRVPHPVAVILTFLVGFGVLFLIGLILASAISDISAKSEVYGRELARLQDDIVAKLPLDRLGLSADEAKTKLNAIFGAKGQDYLAEIGGVLASLLTQGVLVMLYMVFLMLGHSTYRPRGSADGSLKDEIAWQVESYVLTKLGISFFTGLFTWLVLAFIGVDFAIVFALLAFLLNFIPNIGSVIAVLLPLPIMLIDPELGATSIILALALQMVVQFTIGNIVEPKLLGKSMDLHPVAVLFGLVFFAFVWGIIGALLATPLMGVAKILLMRSPYTKRLGALLADTGSPDKAAVQASVGDMEI